jgi:hypothetical protein
MNPMEWPWMASGTVTLANSTRVLHAAEDLCTNVTCDVLMHRDIDAGSRQYRGT